MKKKAKSVSKKAVEKAVAKVMHPEIDYNLAGLGMIKNTSVKENQANIVLLLPFLDVPIKEDLINSIRQAVKKLDKSIKVKIEAAEMNEKEKENFMRMDKKGWIG